MEWKPIIMGIVLVVVISTVLYYKEANTEPCRYIENDKLFVRNEVIQLEANFSERHECMEMTFTNNIGKDLFFNQLTVSNWTFEEPEYMIDDEGRFVKFKMEDEKIFFIPQSVKDGEERKFYYIYGNDTVAVLFLSAYGQTRYTYTVSD